jgi:hypothetical protein
MTRFSFYFVQLLFSVHCMSQNVCSIKNLPNIDKFDFNKVYFVSESNTQDSVTYNCIARCVHSKAKILGNINRAGKKEGHFIVFDSDGEFFVEGNFADNLLEGWWSYGGCCRTEFKHGKKIQTICLTF